MTFLGEERLTSTGKQRSPSPPVRRSISTDRGTVIKSRVKPETIENQPIAKVPFPARVPVNKSLATTTPVIQSTDNSSRVQVNKSLVTTPTIPSTDNYYTRTYHSSQDTTRQDNISESLFSFQKLSSKKVPSEHEDEQFKQALNIRQGGIRKSKPEVKAKAKQQHQITPRLQKSEVVTTLFSDLDISEKIEEVARKSDFSEAENEQVLVGSPLHSALDVKKLRKNFSRNSQNHEPR